MNRTWTLWQKIAFRFFFVFLSLQILTENFLGNLFGPTLFFWRLGDRVFTRPCLWLNDHFFHFKYVHQGWTSFSGALHTIRDFIYLLFSALVCALWTVLDKRRPGYSQLLYWFSRCLTVMLACIMFTYGIMKLFPIQMIGPSFIDLNKRVGELSPFDLLWLTYGYGTPYQVFSGFFEVAGAILILFKRTRVLGLLIIAAVIMNVILLNYTFHVGVLILSCYILFVALFLLAPYIFQLWKFFVAGGVATLSLSGFKPTKKYAIRIFAVAATILVASSFFLTTKRAYDTFARRENIDRTRQYSLVEKYMVNDTLEPEDDLDCWKIWSERMVDGKRMVTIALSQPGITKSFFVEGDSMAHQMILRPFGQTDTTSLNFMCTEANDAIWSLEGTIEQKNVLIQFRRVRPDTAFTLLKIKRNIIVFDDEPNE